MLLVIFYGSFICTLYTSYLGSFLVVTLENQNFTFICDDEKHDLFLHLVPKMEHSVKWRTMTYPSYVELVERLEPSNYGYCMLSDAWEAYNSLQSSFAKRRFKVFHETENTIPYTAYARKPFNSVFDDFLVKSFSSGLVSKWFEDFFFIKFIAQIGKVERNLLRQLLLDDFAFPMKLISWGFLASFVVFCFEVVVKIILK